jgi:hypothetical protein
MFNPSSVVIEAFLVELRSHYFNLFGDNADDMQQIAAAGRNALEIIANSDAPYHDMNHTIMVTMVGTEILRGKLLIEGNITASDWVHFVISLLNHDIGYARGICRADRSGRYAINDDYETISPPPGATDAVLTPFHVDRAQLYIRERFQDDDRIDVDIICRNIERTRFPVPSEDDHQESTDLPGLLRAADLIGQLADPQYINKIGRLFAEFSETGQVKKMGYNSAADLRADYPKFFWEVVSPFITEGIRYLRRTQDGQAWVANLYANVFTEEHEAPAYGPERRAFTVRRVNTETVFTITELSGNDKRSQYRRTTDLSAENEE